MIRIISIESKVLIIKLHFYYSINLNSIKIIPSFDAIKLTLVFKKIKFKNISTQLF